MRRADIIIANSKKIRYGKNGSKKISPRCNKRARKQPACCKNWSPETEELRPKRPVLDVVTNRQDESTGLALGISSPGNKELSDIDHSGVCDISGLLSAAEMDDINNSLFGDLPDIVDDITASSTEPARVHGTLHSGDTANSVASSSECAITAVLLPPVNSVNVMAQTVSPNDPAGITGSVELSGTFLVSAGSNLLHDDPATGIERLIESSMSPDESGGPRGIMRQAESTPSFGQLGGTTAITEPTISTPSSEETAGTVGTLEPVGLIISSSEPVGTAGTMVPKEPTVSSGKIGAKWIDPVTQRA